MPHKDTQEYRSLLADLHQAVAKAISDGYNIFLSGGASGFDLLAAEEVLRQKYNHAQLALRMILPYVNQSARYSVSDAARYKELLAQSESVHYISEPYTRDCMFRRNERLIFHAELCIAYLRKSRGGTFMTVNMAKRKGIDIILL